ncbi:hypothetical protein [Actinoplanes sp. NPDC023714]|uniref:hypothetical protein n=1 Tax=Actinoplanes sp. NPDC023714 TaxID=3154322 RepID=UPI0033CB2AD9
MSRLLTTLFVDTLVIVELVDEFTGRPPQIAPAMRLRRAGAEEPEEPASYRRTAGGGVVFAAFDLVRRAAPAAAVSHELHVEGDAALRPDRPGGYPFTVPADPARWPVRVGVRLLPGPAYPYPRHVPVVHGRVLRAGAPVAEAVVEVRPAGGGTVTARCAADEAGRFSAGIADYRAPDARTPRPLALAARAPDGAASAVHLLAPEDFTRSIDLTVP